MKMLSREVDRVLRAAGWHPGREVDISPWRNQLEGAGFHVHDVAEKFLAEFGGLNVDIHGPGISRARTPFELDPLLCLGEDDRFSEWSGALGRFLFPVGELDRGRYFLGIDEEGEIYIVVDWLARFGPVPVAFEKLIRGIAADPIQL